MMILREKKEKSNKKLFLFWNNRTVQYFLKQLSSKFIEFVPLSYIYKWVRYEDIDWAPSAVASVEWLVWWNFKIHIRIYAHTNTFSRGSKWIDSRWMLLINNSAPFYMHSISSKSFRRDIKRLLINNYRKLLGKSII